MNNVTLILSYYINPGMLADHYARWAAYPDDLKAHLRVIVVDDGSPTGAAMDVERPEGLPDLRIYRMRKDIRWGQDGCRNLGADEAKTKWLLLTDMDHALPVETLRAVVAAPLRKNNVYRFGRVSAPAMAPYKPHPNSWLMTGEMYDRIGGYDERFLGYYGSDGQFRNGVVSALKGVGEIVMLDDVLIRVPREVTADASTTVYGRKEPQDSEGMTRIKAEIADLPEEMRRPARVGLEWDRLL